MMSSQQLSAGLIQAIEQHPKKADEILRQFLSFCRDHHLMGLLPGVVRHLQTLQEQKTLHESVLLTFPRAPHAQTVENVKKAFSVDDDAPEIITREEALIGGFIMRYRDVVYDGSVRTQIAGMRKSMMHD